MERRTSTPFHSFTNRRLTFIATSQLTPSAVNWRSPGTSKASMRHPSNGLKWVHPMED